MSTIAVVALAAFAPLSALADDEGRLYALAGFGTARTDLGAAEDYYRAQAAAHTAAGATRSEATSDDSSPTFSFGFGYWLHRNVAVEGYFRDFGRPAAGVSAAFPASASAEETEYRAAGLGAGLLGLVPVGQWLSLYGRVDLVSMRTEYETVFAMTPGSGGTSVGDDSEVQAGFGLGAQYDFRHGISARVDWQRIEAPLGQAGLDGAATIDSLNVFLVKSL
jgi:hypothetical protein